MARTGADLGGVASFHGSLGAQTKAEPGTIKAKILVMTGGDDTYIPAEQVEEFRKEMDAAGADYEVIVYPEATHSFTNPGADELGKKFDLPVAYNAEADKQSWAELEEFLKEVFNQDGN
jgi:dienelactone hydrolase